MGTREVDDDGVGRGLERGGALVVEAAEDEVGARRERGLVVDERRQAAVEARVERRRGRAGERVRAERDELELRMGEDTVERLLTGVARGADDGGVYSHRSA